MPTKTLKKMTLKLDTLKVQSMIMPATAPIRAVTTSHTCPTKCDTHEACSNEYCVTYSEPGTFCQTNEYECDTNQWRCE